VKDPSRHSKAELAPTARAALGLVLGLLALASGCGTPTSRKPNLYEVRGRVLDATTGQGIINARVRLRAAIPTGGFGQTLVGYAVSGVDGTYAVELSAKFDVMRYARAIEVYVSKSGYVPAGADLPPPAKKQPHYKAPDIALAPGRAPQPPPDPSRLGVPVTEPRRANPLPWKRRP